MSDDDVQNRMGQRFGNENQDGEGTIVVAPDVSNIRNEWESINVYAPKDPLVDRIEEQYARLNYQCDFNVNKGRHFYPLVLVYGIETIEETEASEIPEMVRQLEL